MDLSRLIQADSTLFSTEYLSLVETDDGMTYCHENLAAKGMKVAVVPYAFLDGEFFCLAAYERCRPNDPNPQLCSMTGKCEESDLDDLRAAALRELKEEAGIDADYWSLTDFGMVYPSKSMDTAVYCFGVDVTQSDIKFGEAIGDGSQEEAEMGRKWLNVYQIGECTDPILHAVIFRLFADTGVLGDYVGTNN